MQNKYYKKLGFTLVELLIVVAIISILMLISIVKYADYTPGSKIRVFEVNSKTLISEINTSYMSNNRKIDNIYDDVNDRAVSLKEKPEGSSYSIDKNTGILKCILKKESFKGEDDYVIEYDVANETITQKPTKLPSGAVNLSN